MKYLVPEEVQTERLVLRQFNDADWQDLHAYYSSEQAITYTVGRVFSEGDTWRAMSSMLGHWQLRGYGPYALEEKSSGRVIGICGFWFPNDWPEPEIKWALSPEFWGKGYASEAARAVQKVGREYLPDISLISFINENNQASIELAKAVGAKFDKAVPFRGATWHIYRHPG